MQADNSKAMSACAEAIKAGVRPKEPRPDTPKGCSRKLSPLAYIGHPRLGNVLVAALPTGSGFARQRSRPRWKPSSRLQVRLQLRLPKVPSPGRRLLGRGLCLPTGGWKGWWAPWAAVCVALVSSCAVCTSKPAAGSIWKKKKKAYESLIK